MKVPQAPAATAVLQGWLASLNEGNTPIGGGSAMVEALAPNHRSTLQNLLADLAVQEAIERAYGRPGNAASRSKRLDVLKSLLVDSCWIQKMMGPQEQTGNRAAAPQSSERTVNLKSLEGAARKARSLAQNITALSSVSGSTLTGAYLQQRLASGNRPGFIATRKGWGRVSANKDASISDLLLMLEADLLEEAAILRSRMKNTRQEGGSKRHLYPLIDSLCQSSVQLGDRRSDGTPCPDFHFVHAVLTSILPNESLDEGTLRKRWGRKGKLKPKSP